MEYMVDVEFDFNQKITIIQAKLDEPFQFIIDQYIQKDSINPNCVYFVVNSKLIEPHQKVENYMSDIDKQNNKLSVVVHLINEEKEIKNEKQFIIQSKDIVCPECKEPCRFTLDNYKIKLFGCIHNHATSEIKLEDFYETQKKEMQDIKCVSCKNINKECINEFFECLTCKESLCYLCMQKHDLNHNIIKYYQKDYICTKHNNFFNKYYIDCNSNMYPLSDKEHSQHKIIVYSQLKPDIDQSKKKFKEFREELDILTEYIYGIIEKLKKLIEDLNTYYEINSNILKNYEESNINYQILKNINEIDTNDKIYEKIMNINSYINKKDKIKDIFDLYININEKNEKIENDEIPEKNEITPKKELKKRNN